MRNIRFVCKLDFMRKIILSIAVMFASATLYAHNHSSDNDPAAAALLGRLSHFVKQLGRYEAVFDMRVGDYVAKGSFLVDADSYYIEVGQAEVYCDGKARYEVDNEREEVNIDNVDSKSRNILDNPTRCFDFVGSDYRAEVVSSGEKTSTIKLLSNDKSDEGEIYLTIDNQTARPMSIEYRLYDDIFEVAILSIAKTKSSPAKFDRSRYRTCEIIDFR